MLIGISIHAPLTGSDLIKKSVLSGIRGFQSTLPLRGATRSINGLWRSARFQSTLPLRGATRVPPRKFITGEISIHAPLTGSDCALSSPCLWQGYFNPRSPYGERLDKDHYVDNRTGISIHAPLTGSDPLRRAYKKRRNHFNPRSPYGERLNTS